MCFNCEKYSKCDCYCCKNLLLCLFWHNDIMKPWYELCILKISVSDKIYDQSLDWRNFDFLANLVVNTTPRQYMEDLSAIFLPWDTNVLGQVLYECTRVWLSQKMRLFGFAYKQTNKQKTHETLTSLSSNKNFYTHQFVMHFNLTRATCFVFVKNWRGDTHSPPLNSNGTKVWRLSKYSTKNRFSTQFLNSKYQLALSVRRGRLLKPPSPRWDFPSSRFCILVKIAVWSIYPPFVQIPMFLWKKIQNYMPPKMLGDGGLQQFSPSWERRGGGRNK